MNLREKTIEQLHAEHQDRDKQIVGLRAEMLEIHDEIVRKEQLAAVPGDPSKLQTVGGVVTPESLLETLAGLGADAKEKFMKLLKGDK